MIGVKYDASVSASAGGDRYDLDIEEIVLEQNFDFLISRIGFPSKINLVAKCFLESDSDKFLATFDKARVTFGNINEEDVYYQLSGLIEESAGVINNDVLFEHSH